MHTDNLGHQLLIWERNIVKNTAPQESVRQFLFRVGGDDHNGPLLCPDGPSCFRDVKFHSVQLPQQVIGKFQICLINLIDQQDRLVLAGERLAQFSKLHVLLHLVHARKTQLAVIQPLDHVIDVESFLSLCGGLDVPNQQPLLQRLRYSLCQDRLSGTRLSLDQKRLLQSDGDVCHLQEFFTGHIFAATSERTFHKTVPPSYNMNMVTN